MFFGDNGEVSICFVLYQSDIGFPEYQSSAIVPDDYIPAVARYSGSTGEPIVVSPPGNANALDSFISAVHCFACAKTSRVAYFDTKGRTNLSSPHIALKLRLPRDAAGLAMYAAPNGKKPSSAAAIGPL